MSSDSKRHSYVVAGCRPWNRKTFDEKLKKLPGTWHFVSKKEELNADFLSSVSPRYIFFLHWSYIVPDEILSKFECVCFHMTDLPFGRGGTPLQNMLLLGCTESKVSAFRMVKEIDAGPIYMKAPLSLEGTAQQIYIRTQEISAELIFKFIKESPVPVPQEGEVVLFRRRTPQQSDLSEVRSVDEAYDFIRMLDADEYPRAFLQLGSLRYEFSKAMKKDGKLTVEVSISEAKESVDEGTHRRRTSR